MKSIRIILDADQIERINDALGRHGAALVVVGRGSLPDAAGLAVLHAVPTTVHLADEAVKVALGEKVARKKPKRKSD